MNEYVKFVECKNCYIVVVITGDYLGIIEGLDKIIPSLLKVLISCFNVGPL